MTNVNFQDGFGRARAAGRAGLMLATLLAAPFGAVHAAEESAEATAAAPAGAASEFSEAETRMWLTDQLANIEEPMLITYRFVRAGTYDEGFEDKVEFRVSNVRPNGMKSASLNFFSGERNFPVPPVESTNVNPVLGVYLQGDVYEMNRLTDERGTAKERWRYFHRQIKHALANGAEVKKTTVSYGDRDVEAYNIVFTPYVNDPHRDEFDRFADKRYSVTVSEEIPGYLFEIETVIPGEGLDFEKPLIAERLKFESAVPLSEG